MKESNLALYFFSALLASVFVFFFLIVFIESGSLIFALFVNFIFLLVTFSPLRKLLLGKMVRFFQILFVSSLAAMTSILVFITIPLSIGEYYDRKAALTPSWVYYLSMYMGITGIVLGFISAYFIFKKYYRKSGEKDD
jgi:Na+/serine symporter